MASVFSQSEGRRAGGDAQTQLQSRLQGLRSSIEGVRDIAEEAIRACTVAALDLEEVGDSSGVGDVDASLRALLDAQHRLGVERELMTRLATQPDTDAAAADYRAERAQRMGAYDAQSDAQKYARNAQYRDFRQQVWDVRHEGEAMPGDFLGAGGGGGDGDESDEDLVIAGAKSSYRCPVSASWLVQPVTSRECGHSFSKEAITQYIRAHRGACDCPVDGCRKRIRAADLFPDQVLERKVARHLRQLEAEETAAQYTLVQ
ncbi:hypothetical protein IWQ56_001784 [Coemansia nantahalensis]|uniref:Uncharacterized protein n=1 Tax=Coemansia helicoidea TaxID=1286919 RepID=A0ACC1LF26_9FUNG|nr:hypothetical protein IWQ56_001784 [Coemansia nantahalensis]KAJ2806464.1 hypothetical protein H4R21_000858 [Coemansia helicoidea]